ncbi:hypothetical protein F5Y05DRAFT_365706 [Hypoxylon sp. FL0543]|nr:hypothetical protein F5Y05DRAFT_365706 [Hypoxylon sp. FL0543]
MSNDYGVVRDTSLPLSQIRDRHNSSIISSVLDLKRHAITRDSSLKSLGCLYLADDNEGPIEKRRRVSNGSVAAGSSELLKRRYLNPVSGLESERDYIAVSYTWEPSKQEEEEGKDEEEASGRFLIESHRTGKPPLPSDVRDGVWRRVLNYADHVDCENIWIDRECIDQDNDAEKSAMIQSMHLVYGQSKHPIALLTRPIDTAEELDLLIDLMCGEVSVEDEPAVLDLLKDITSDLWWTRAWTFQEDYRASIRMKLLIPHHRSLERRKLAVRDNAGRHLLGRIDGEICIYSIDFRKRATEFCLSHRKRSGRRDICDKILKAATKYNVLLRDERAPADLASISRSMSPLIISDIDSRGITEESDRLAIIANCCWYNTRLNTSALDSECSSLSLSTLALYLLNGEVLENNPKQANRGSLDDNIHEFLSKQSLNSFRPPIDEGLTFIKSCRFIKPQLTAQGTLTEGHLWRLGKVIRRKPLKEEKYRTLPPLDEFAAELYYGKYGRSYAELAFKIQQWSLDPINRRNRRTCPGWREWMAEEVERALEDGDALRLGCLVHPKYGSEDSPYRAIFVGDSNKDWEDETVGSYAFTSIQPAKPHARGEIDRHVSLEVEVEWQKQEGSERRPSPADPKLYIKRWLNGLCFFEFEDVPPQPRPVLFPWPSALLE